MLQPLQQPQEAAHLPPVRDGKPGPDPTERSRASVHRAGDPGGPPGFAGEVDRNARRGTGRASAVLPRAASARAPPPPPRLAAVGAQCELDEREWRLTVSLLRPLVPASLRRRPGGMSAPRMTRPHGRDFGCGKVVDPLCCSPGTSSPSTTLAEPCPGKHLSRLRLRAMSVPSGLSSPRPGSLRTLRARPPRPQYTVLMLLLKSSNHRKMLTSAAHRRLLAPTYSLLLPAHRERACMWPALM